MSAECDRPTRKGAIQDGIAGAPRFASSFPDPHAADDKWNDYVMQEEYPPCKFASDEICMVCGAHSSWDECFYKTGRAP